MTARERLHVFVDELPEDEIGRAARVLAAFPEPSPARARPEVPLDDEPETAEERVAVAAAWEDVRAGRVIPQEEIERELGLR